MSKKKVYNENRGGFGGSGFNAYRTHTTREQRVNGEIVAPGHQSDYPGTRSARKRGDVSPISNFHFF